MPCPEDIPLPIVADAAVAIRGDLSKFPADLKQAEKPVAGLGNRLKSLLSPGALLAGFAGGFAALHLTDFLADAVTAASDLNETVAKTGQIFGEEALPGLEEWADTAAETFGQSKQQALDAASTFAIFGKAAGLAGDELTGFSTDLVQLSSDMASFFNTSPEDAITAIGAALRGESEPIRRYGVLLNEATLQQRALSLGIIESTKQALTPQQRVLAAQAEIFAQTSDAQGDFARTSDGLANQQRILQATLDDVSAEIGQQLLPIMVDLVTFLNDEAVPAFRDFISLISGDTETAARGDSFFGDVARGATILADSVRGDGKLVQRIMDQTGLSYGQARDLILKANEEMGISALELSEQLKDGLHPFTSGQMTEEWAEAWQDMGTALTTEGGRLVPKVEEVVTDIGDAANDQMQVQVDKLLAKAEEVPEGFAVELRNGKTVVGASVDELAQLLPAAIRRANAEARLEAKKAPGEIADAILSGKDELKPVRKLIRDILAGSVSDGRTLAENAALLINPGIAEALTSNSTEAKAAMLDEVVNPLLASIKTLEPGAFDATAEVSPAMADALRSNQRLVIDAMRDIVGDSNATLGELAYYAQQNGLDGIAAYIRGIRAQRRGAEQAAQEIMDRVAARLMASGQAYGWGYNVGDSYSRGLLASKSLLDQRTKIMTDAMADALGFAGSPMYTHSRELGEGVGKSYTEGLWRSLGAGLGGLGGYLTSAIGASTSVPSMATASVASGGAAGTFGGDNINVYLPGRTREVTASEITTELRRQSEAGYQKRPRRMPND